MENHLKTIITTLITLITLWGLGYVLLIIPQQKSNRFLQSSLQKLSVNHVKQAPAAKKSFHFDAKDDVLRWLSDEGRLVSWKRQKKACFFVWVGSYRSMLALIQRWPDPLKVDHMHWEKNKTTGIRWRGSYAVSS